MEMTPEKWQRVKVLFEAALDRPSEARLQYLADACSDDDLRAEVARLLTNLEDAGSFLNNPALTGLDLLTTRTEDGFLPAGRVLADRFKLTRFLARGGMGEVYEAQDLELQEHVALKLVRPELLSDSHAMQRFKREVHLAKKVTHPNVCRTFDLFRHHDVNDDAARDLIFVSMELLAGETLSQYLRRRGRLSPAEALPLTTQIAGGMEAAHKVGVIHRDFKPGNIILAPEGTASLRAVITDFGLALRSGGDGTTVEMSASHGIVGTPAYMAPEQIEGREVTAATDIYAFGLVLHEMLTGSLPFASETPLGKAARRLHESIPSPRTIVPDFDPTWEGVILRCLERDPDKRFASISELLPALTQRESAGERKLKVASEKEYRRVLAFAVLLLFVAGITVYARRTRNAERTPLTGPSYSGSSPIKMRPAVAVLGFRNVSKQTEKDWLSESLTEALSSELSEGGQLRLVSGESVARMKMDLSLPDSDSYAAGTLHQIRQNIAADYVIQGSFLDLGDQTSGQIRVDARLQDARSGETVDSVIENGNEADLNGLLVKTGADLRQKLKVNAPSLEQQTQGRAALPSNLDAARYYAEGLQKLRAFDSLGARDSLEIAVQKEPTFALAYSALATAWANLGYDAKARDSAKKALDLSASLDYENRQWIEAQFYEAGHEQGKAIAAFQSLFSAHPDNLEYGLRLLAAMVRGGQSKNAQSIVDALRGLPAPAVNDPRIDLLSANAAIVSGDYKQSVILAKAAETKAESTGAKLTLALALMRRGAALMYLGQKKEAIELDEKALRIFAEEGDRDDVAKMNANLGAVLNSDANFAEGMKRQKESLEEFRRIGDRRGEALTLGQLGWAAEAQDRLDEAQTWFEQALLIDRELGGNGAGTIGKLAEILQYKGDLSGATRRNEQVLAIAKESGNLSMESGTLNNLIDLYTTQGDLATAKELLSRANAVFAKTGEKRGTAIALGGWGRILMAENNLAGARQKYEESLRILTLNDEKQLLPYCQMSLATLAIEQGHTSDAKALLTQVMNYFHSQRNSADEGWAMGIYARAELESGNIAGAQQMAEKAKALCVHDQTLSSVGVRLFAARAEGLTGNRKEAETELKNSLKVAERQGNVELAFDARFALGEIAVKLQDPSGRKILNDLSRDAASRGFLLLSRKASNLAESANVSQH
jgi:serine/threonine protein kinase/tetratricopeptide (TPR) repeat protein